ncbi:MAG: hypothetical protein U0936_21155 [Planctomycetaceae bacterium]
MTTPADRSLTTANQGTSVDSGLSVLMRSLAVPTIDGVLQRALYDGSLHPVQASGALSADAGLNEILRSFPPYSTDATCSAQRDFTLTYTGSAEARLEAVRRLTTGFWAARGALDAIRSQGRDEDSQQLQIAVSRLNAGYVLLIATVHSLIDSPNSPLFAVFRELLEADPRLKELSVWFSDVRSARGESSQRVAVRIMFEKFCSEATQPTIYGDAISAIVQSMLIRELRQVIDNRPNLAPQLAKLFEDRMRGEVTTARIGDGKPQPVLQALRRCPAEAKALMDAVVAFLMTQNDAEPNHAGSTLTSCEVMLSVGCLLPGTGLVRRLDEMVSVPELPPEHVLLFLSALKFSCYLPDADVKVDALTIIQRGLEILPQLSPDDRSRLIREVFAPLDDAFLEYFATSPDAWTAMSAESRSQCIGDIITSWLARNEKKSAKEVSPATKRTLAALLLNHVSELQSGVEIHSEVVTGSEPDNTRLADADETSLGQSKDDVCEKTSNLPKLPDQCLRWLITNSVACDASPELCTELVRYLCCQPEGLQSSTGTPDAMHALLLRGGFPAIRLLAEETADHQWLARVIGEYVPCSEEESSYIEAVVRDRFIDRLRTQINSRAATIDSQSLAEQSLIRATEAQESFANDRRRAEALALQVSVLFEHLQGHEDYLRAERDLHEAITTLDPMVREYEELDQLTARELVENRKTRYKESLAARIQTQRDAITDIESRKFDVPANVKYKLTDWKASQIVLGQFHDMQKQSARLNEKLAKVDGTAAEIRGTIRTLETEVAGITSEIARFFPLVRYACRSQALIAVNPAELEIQSAGSTDLMGVMCKANLTLPRYAGTKNDQEGAGKAAVTHHDSDTVLPQLGAEISTALRHAFRIAAQKPLSFAVLNDLADLAEDSCRLFSIWPELPPLGSVRKFNLTDLDHNVSLLELLYRNLRFDLRSDTVSWGGSRMGWDDSFHGPVLRIFAGIAAASCVGSEIRKAAAIIVMDGLTAEVGRHMEADRLLSEDAELPAMERRLLPSNLVPVPDLLRAYGNVLRATLGKPLGDSRDNVRKTQYVNVANGLAAKAESLIATATDSEFNSCFIPAAKAIWKARKDAQSALLGQTDSCLTFLSRVNARIERRVAPAQSVSVDQSVDAGTGPVSGLSFSGGLFRSLALPEVHRPNWLRLGHSTNSDRER